MSRNDVIGMVALAALIMLTAQVVPIAGDLLLWLLPWGWVLSILVALEDRSPLSVVLALVWLLTTSIARVGDVYFRALPLDLEGAFFLGNLVAYARLVTFWWSRRASVTQ